MHHAVPGEKAVQGVVGRSSRPSAMTSPGDSSRCSSARFPIFPQGLPFNCGALSVFHASLASSPHSSRSKAARKLTSMFLHVGRCHAPDLPLSPPRAFPHPRPSPHPVNSWSPSFDPARGSPCSRTRRSRNRRRAAAAPQPTVHVLGRECRETGHMTT